MGFDEILRIAEQERIVREEHAQRVEQARRDELWEMVGKKKPKIKDSDNRNPEALRSVPAGYISLRDCARQMDIGYDTMLRWATIAKVKLPKIKHKGVYYVMPDQVQRYMDEHAKAMKPRPNGTRNRMKTACIAPMQRVLSATDMKRKWLEAAIELDLIKSQEKNCEVLLPAGLELHVCKKALRGTEVKVLSFCQNHKLKQHYVYSMLAALGVKIKGIGMDATTNYYALLLIEYIWLTADRDAIAEIYQE
jgi:predicted DNA-binding protein (UPF0251 family)